MQLMNTPSAQPPTRPKPVILDYYPTLPTLPTTPLTPKNIMLTEPMKETKNTISTKINIKKIQEKTPVQKTQSPMISKRKSVQKKMSESMKKWLKSGNPKSDSTKRSSNSVQNLIMMHEQNKEASTNDKDSSNTRSGDHLDKNGAHRLT